MLLPSLQVYKIVPGLEKDEYDRERKFYADRGLPCPKDQVAEEEKDSEHQDKEDHEHQMTPDANTNMDYHRFDEQVDLLLECKLLELASTPGAMSASSSSSATQPPQLKCLKRKYIRCSSLATVTHLKKFIAKKLLHSTERYKDVDITCNGEPLYKDHTLKFVYVTRWRTKEPPMRLQYVPKEDPVSAAAPPTVKQQQITAAANQSSGS